MEQIVCAETPVGKAGSTVLFLCIAHTYPVCCGADRLIVLERYWRKLLACLPVLVLPGSCHLSA